MFNNFKEEINQTITNSVNLDKIQKAINDGCGVNMTMPSANNNKLMGFDSTESTL